MDAESISTVVVVGAGTMGAGIAGVFARAGREACLVDRDDELLAQGMKNLRRAQQALVEAGRLSSDEGETALLRVRTTTVLEAACEGVDLVVEAVNEDLGLKREIFAQLDARCPAGAVFASNTSGLSITGIARATGRPDRVAGMHFWNPPHIVPLVEITRGAQTSEDTAELLMAVCRQLGKRPILVRHEIPGFVGNRLQFAVFREALHLLAEGVASAEDIDTAMSAGPGLRYGLLGPLRTADLGGLDIFLAISRYLFAELNSKSDPPDLLAELVEKGRLGAKAGAGIYDYSEGDVGRSLSQRDRVLLGFLDVLEREGIG